MVSHVMFSVCSASTLFFCPVFIPKWKMFIYNKSDYLSDHLSAITYQLVSTTNSSIPLKKETAAGTKLPHLLIK